MDLLRAISFFIASLLLSSCGSPSPDLETTASKQAPTVQAQMNAPASGPLGLSANTCTELYERVRDAMQNRVATTAEEPFERAYLAQAAAQAIEEMGFNYDATVRSMMFVNFLSVPACRDMLMLVPADKAKARDMGLITDRTVGVYEFFSRFKRQRPSEKASRLMEAMDRCEDQYGPPCELSLVCDFMDVSGLQATMKNWENVECSDIFDPSRKDEWLSFSDDVFNVEPDEMLFFTDETGKPPTRAKPDSIWSLNRTIIAEHNAGMEMIRREADSFE